MPMLEYMPLWATVVDPEGTTDPAPPHQRATASSKRTRRSSMAEEQQRHHHRRSVQCVIVMCHAVWLVVS
ncbi:hypothetical protein PFLUV_G00263110 [Perca fluviatilis]|uniref:Uncharacterized protein n=1 Tax=Perca fluviatilis TaxID=8168 RepID=A0A6A5E201_PERFL|nr:hypothetical protein PFLUV_G00263110 [Perca fluviatilis]